MSDFQDNYNTKHKKLSYYKSIIRIAGCTVLAIFAPSTAFLLFSVLFIVAEVLGILEEQL